MILNALEGKPLPVYGAGLNIRDWIHVEDHCRGIWAALMNGKPGEAYCFGGNSERRNIDVVKAICEIIQAKKPLASGTYQDLITFVEDRAGHDFRYAIDDSRAQTELGYKREYANFEIGLEATVNWYLDNTSWIKTVMSKPK
jgi:dTDP-glucose 4,6-dehydratase